MSEAKILIIEDDADVRLGLEVLLNAHHYRTFFAADAVAALTAAVPLLAEPRVDERVYPAEP